MNRTLVVAVAVLVIILGIVAYAGAATSESDSVVVTASVNPKLTLDLSTNTLSWTVDPDDLASSQWISATVKSNKAYTLTHSWPTSDASLTDDFTNTGGGRTAGDVHGVNVTFTPSWTMDPDLGVTGTLQFTATQ
jgi:hypothetical protein